MKTREIISVGIVFVILAILFPPFETYGGRNCGYGFLFTGKELKTSSILSSTCKIDVSLLLVELLLIGLIAAFIYFNYKNKDE